jgi:hypothetical protein
MHGPREIRMIEDHKQTVRGKHVAYWLSFLTQGAHQFKSPRLSDMGTACLCLSSHSNLITLI